MECCVHCRGVCMCVLLNYICCRRRPGRKRKMGGERQDGGTDRHSCVFGRCVWANALMQPQSADIHRHAAQSGPKWARWKNVQKMKNRPLLARKYTKNCISGQIKAKWRHTRTERTHRARNCCSVPAKQCMANTNTFTHTHTYVHALFNKNCSPCGAGKNVQWKNEPNCSGNRRDERCAGGLSSALAWLADGDGLTRWNMQSDVRTQWILLVKNDIKKYCLLLLLVEETGNNAELCGN